MEDNWPADPLAALRARVRGAPLSRELRRARRGELVFVAVATLGYLPGSADIWVVATTWALAAWWGLGRRARWARRLALALSVTVLLIVGWPRVAAAPLFLGALWDVLGAGLPGVPAAVTVVLGYALWLTQAAVAACLLAPGGRLPERERGGRGA